MTSLVSIVCVSAGIVVAGSGLLWWLARAPDDRRLRPILLTSFWIRASLGIALYAISFQHWPILPSLHVQDGFWTFALDARLYHSWGVTIAEAWQHGIELPDSGATYDYYAIIAAIYRLLGAHPLYAILLHAWLGALTGWLAYRIGQRLFDARSALRGALLVSFWPSSVLWSTQILRDSISWSLILAVLWLVALMVGPDARPLRVRGWRWALQAAALAGATILLARLRVYLGPILVVTALVTLVPAGFMNRRVGRPLWRTISLISRRVGRPLWRTISLISRRVGRPIWRCARLIRRPVVQAAWPASVAALVIIAVVVARDLDTTRLVSPAHPEEGHVRLGLQHQRSGDLAQAEVEFKRAIQLRADYQPAYRLLADLLSKANRPEEALEVCASWPGADDDGAMRQCVSQLKARLSEQALVRKPDATQAAPAVPPAMAQAPAAPQAPGEMGVAPPSPATSARLGPKPRRRRWGKNTPPEVEAGPAQSVPDPQSVVLKGEVVDDGRPTNTLTYHWTQIFGPAPARFATPNALETRVELPARGRYNFYFTASDGDLSGFDGLFVTVEPLPNTPPKVEAGPAQSVPDPQSVVLKGEVVDDGRPTNTLTYHWTQIFGPAPARFATPNALETRVELPARGRYNFYFTASDGDLSGFDGLFVTVEGFPVLAAPPTETQPRLALHPPSTAPLMTRLITQGMAVVHEMSPQWLSSLRTSVVMGGGELMDAQKEILQPFDLITYLPRALLVGFLAPFPQQWFDTSGSTGAMRLFAGVEMAVSYLLLIGLVLRAWRAIRLFGPIGCVRLAIRRMPLGGWFLLVYGLVMGAGVSLVMANMGTLFRIRLLFWLPLLILVAAADPLGSSRWRQWLSRWIARWRGGRPAQVMKPEPVGEPTPVTTSMEPVAGAREPR